MRRIAPGFLAIAVLASCAAAQVSAPRNAVLSAEGATHVAIRAGAGSLRVIGDPTATEVRVVGTARSSSRRLLQDIQLVAERRDGVVHIASILPRARRIGIGFRWSALDLDITVPAGMPVSAVDGSGGAVFRGTGPLRINDGSGALLVEDVLGEVDITDGSGAIVVRNVTGPLRIQDGSGAIRIDGVGHDITIRDGSGGLAIRNVGNVHIVSKRSGSVHVDDATGSVRIDSSGSGAITVRNVGGDFTVGSKRSGAISHHGVRGEVAIPRR